MYSYVSALAKNNTPYSRWEALDVSQVPLNEIYQRFTNVWLILSNPFLPKQVSLDMSKMRVQLEGKTITVAAWLVENANKTLPTNTKLPTIEENVAHYGDAAYSGYTAYPVKPGSYIDNGDLDIADKDWAKIVCRDRVVDYKDMFAKTMVSVNGFYHPTDFDSEGLFIVDAVKSLRRCGQNQIGITSFNNVGTLKFIELKSNMIYKADDQVPFKHGVDINLRQSHKGKSIILVLGGYMFTANENFLFRTSDTTLHVKFDCFDFPQRFMESNRYLNLSSLPLTNGTFAEKEDDLSVLVDVEELMSDAVIKAYFLLPQSFIVLVDNPELVAEYVDVKTPEFACSMITAHRPVYPLQIGHGMVGNYWPIQEKGNWYDDAHKDLWALHMVDTQYNNYHFETTRFEDLKLISDNREPDMPLFPSSYSQGRFVKLMTSSIKLVDA